MLTTLGNKIAFIMRRDRDSFHLYNVFENIFNVNVLKYLGFIECSGDLARSIDVFQLLSVIPFCWNTGRRKNIGCFMEQRCQSDGGWVCITTTWSILSKCYETYCYNLFIRQLRYRCFNFKYLCGLVFFCVIHTVELY